MAIQEIKTKRKTLTFSEQVEYSTYQDGSLAIKLPGELPFPEIAPGWDGARHGAMLNLVPNKDSHGFAAAVHDGTRYLYREDLNACIQRPPLKPGDCLVVAHSAEDPPAGQRVILDFEAVHFVSDLPPEGSFRPPYAGKARGPFGTVADMDTSWLPSLQKPIEIGEYADFAERRGMGGLFMDMLFQSGNSTLKSENSLPNYGRDIAVVTGETALRLCLDDPIEKKRANLINMVQLGIDLFGLVEAGMKWAPNGGHNLGRKLAVGIAAKALGRGDMMLAFGSPVFQEDRQHSYINQRDIDSTFPGAEPFTPAMLGMPEWFSNAAIVENPKYGGPPFSGSSVSRWPERDRSGSEWSKGYRTVNGSANLATCLAAELMGLRLAWAHECFFEYMHDRYWPREENGRYDAKNRISLFAAAMYDAHYLLKPLPEPVTDEDRIETTYESEDKSWWHVGLEPTAEPVSVEFILVPRAERIDGVIGLWRQIGGYAEWTQPFGNMGAILRLNNQGQFDCYDRDDYKADIEVPYLPNTEYRARFDVDPAGGTYGCSVALPEGNYIKIATGYRFRGEMPIMDTLSFIHVGSAGFGLGQISVSGSPPDPNSSEILRLHEEIDGLHNIIADMEKQLQESSLLNFRAAQRIEQAHASAQQLAALLAPDK